MELYQITTASCVDQDRFIMATTAKIRCNVGLTSFTMEWIAIVLIIMWMLEEFAIPHVECKLMWIKMECVNVFRLLQLKTTKRTRISQKQILIMETITRTTKTILLVPHLLLPQLQTIKTAKNKKYAVIT